MQSSTIAIIILAVTMLLFIIDRFPLALVSLASIIAMVLTGLMSFSDAFKGFSSNLVMLVAGMLIIGNALFENNVISFLGQLFFKRFKGDEKKLLMALMIMAAVLSGFLHNVSVMAMMMPLTASFAAKLKGQIKLKNFYMALSHATIIGARFTLVGSSPPMLAQNVLLSTEGVERGMGFFEMSAIAIPVFAVVLLCYYFFLHRLGDKRFDHSTTPEVDTENTSQNVPVWKTVLTGLVMVVVALCFVFVDSIALGVISLAGACVLIFAGCVNGKAALKKMDWSTLIILACSSGIAACFNMTGLGEVIESTLTRLGSGMTSPFLLVVIFTVAASLTSNVLSNSTITIIFSTLAVSVAQGLGIDPIPLVIAVVFGGGCAFVMPTATSTLTMSNSANYAFKDYALIGSILSLICCAVSILAISLVYGLI